MTDVEFSRDQRICLGLEEDETFRVLAARDRTILLERVPPEGPRAYPWDRDLILNCDIRSFSCADVMNLIHGASKSGFLAFEYKGQSKSVFFHRGEVVFAASNQPVDRLGACLLRNALLSPEQYSHAAESYTPPGHYGKVLVEKGYLTPREIWNGVKIQVEEIVRSLFAYSAGTALFWEGEVRPDNVVRLSLPTSRLIEEGLARREELHRFLALLKDPNIVLEVVEGATQATSETERAIVDAARNEASFDDVVRNAGIDPLTAARTVQLLRLLGTLRVNRVESIESVEEAAEGTQGEDEALRECVTVHVKLLAELAAPIVAIEGGEALSRRLTLVAEDAARRYPEILGGVTVGSHGTLDPELIARRALAVKGDREDQVRSALGELISYLEFDLLNHPGIDDSEVFLEGVDHLRASL